MFDVERIVKMHVECVDRWHRDPVESHDPVAFQGYDEGYMGVAIRQHRYNYDLWHQEDIARSPDVSDAQIAQVKRNIDRLNQARNDWIEKLDDWLTAALEETKIEPLSDARLNTETPGSAVDRLSIMSLRIYHLREQLQRTDVDAQHMEKVQLRLQMCEIQISDLARSLTELLGDLQSGVRRHRTYRQYKMYNDPTLNPYLYGRKKP